MSDLPLRRPSDADLAALAARHPANPFLTPAYARARAALGARAWLVGAGCLAFAEGRLRGRSLDVPSCTGDDDPAALARALGRLARRQLLWTLRLDTFGSAAGTAVPRLPGERARHTRVEHVLALDGDVESRLSANHRRSVRKAREAGVNIEHGAGVEAADAHVALMSASLERRAQRGEDTHGVARAEVLALLASGAGRIVRAVGPDGGALSSLLLLLAGGGAYYHSAGTSSEGMQVGASPLLIVETARRMRAEGRMTFNLGGAAEAEAGLFRFKRGFGGTAVELERAEAALVRFRRRAT